MNVLIFGATGMVGQGVLRECLLAADVERILIIGRSASAMKHPKLREIVHSDLQYYSGMEAEMRGFDACFFCLGVSSTGMRQEDYEHITYGITLAAAETLARLNPQMTFIYVSGAGTDSSEHGRSMWARVKGKTENALLRLPFKAAYMFRPGFIESVHGAKSKTGLYRLIYALSKPFMPLLRMVAGKYILTTEQVGRAMLHAVRKGAPRRILEVQDIRLLASS